jgi:hypothetical protein
MRGAIQVLVAISLSLALAVGISAQEKKVKPKEVTVTGRIVDPECYMKMGAKGYSEEHHECAESCAKGGIPLMFLDDKTNDLYLAANEGMSMKSANETLLPYLDDKVTITGKLVEMSGARLLVTSSIEKTK